MQPQSFHKWLLVTIAGIVLAGSVAWTGDGDYYQEVKKGLRLFGDIYKNVTEKYVDEIRPGEFIRAGIDGLLADLDPYTVYYEGSETSELDLLMLGKYGGIGVSIGVKDGYLTVISTADQSPGRRAGILPGDRIVAVDGQTLGTLNYQEMSNLVRGDPGTKVHLTIVRPGLERTLEFQLIRETVHVENISYAGMIADGVGFIKLTKFSKNAEVEFAGAMEDLQRRGMKSLIIDLRGNPGGLLEVGIDIANQFIRRGSIITVTRGRTAESNRVYQATRDPRYPELPLAVLVDEGSASASEVLAGALQDLDRAVIIGMPTFGKGLVQSVYPLQERNSVLKITTAKYYTPSGRCIQKANYRGSHVRRGALIDNTENETFGQSQQMLRLDSTADTTTYRTASGRKVYGNGGIQPDVVVQEEPPTEYVSEILRRGLIFDFVTRHYQFLTQHALSIDSAYEISDSDLNAFRTLVDTTRFEYVSRIEQRLSEVDTLARTGHYPDDFGRQLSALRKTVRSHREGEFHRNAQTIKRTIELEMISRALGNHGRIAAALREDRVVAEARKVLSEKTRYQMILSGR